MALKMSSSHFIDEHEGRTDANASTGFSCSTLFVVARFIRVMAPSGAFTVTRCFAAPRAAINERLAVYHSHNGVVVVHQVAMGYMSQPHAHLRALARSAFRDKSVALAVVSHERGVYKQGLSAASVKGKDKHERVVQSEDMGYSRPHTVSGYSLSAQKQCLNSLSACSKQQLRPMISLMIYW